MTTNQTIDGVPRADLESICEHFEFGRHWQAMEGVKKLRALLDAPGQDEYVPEGILHAAEYGAQVDAIGILKQAAQPHGEPVAEVYRGPVSGASRIRWIDYKTAPVGTKLYAEQPAPVAVVLPERREPTQDNPYLSDADHEWNACRDELKRLNPSM